MATAVVTKASTNTVSVEERRWVVVGICLTKVLTPALRDVLANEMPMWYQNLRRPPSNIDKQTFKSHVNKLSPCTNLKYESINNNQTTHKTSYDYAVKDPVSLAKLFVKPFMASFTGFDQTMDTSAALSVVAEAQPFHVSGACLMAKKIRSDVRNKWAHCNLAYWTDVNYKAALKDIESLINNLNLVPIEKKRALDNLADWKDNGLKLCFSQAVDSELYKLFNAELAELNDSVKLWKEDADVNQRKILKTLECVENSLEKEIQDMKDRQLRTENNLEQLRAEQLALSEAVSRKNEEELRHLFLAPKKTKWFSGRASELELLRNILENGNTNSDKKVIVAAVSGLGGSGKTCLIAEYTHRWKNQYEGGVYWFSGEGDVKFKASIDDVAAQFNTLHDDSLDATMSKTLAAFSRITKPWLVVVDDMDAPNLSQNLLKLVSGSWQANVNCVGHLIITTRRTSPQLNECIHDFKDSRFLKLECFGLEEGKSFVFKRTGIMSDEQTDLTANHLVQTLGGLPLALEQACAYITYLKCTLAEYIKSYEKQSLKLLNKKKASPVYETSQKRLAVSTTWHLNFEHIQKNEIGTSAIRFMNASAFMSPDEIQEELINIGNPCIEDEAYCEQVTTSLGAREVLKLLTDFSLCKETRNSSLCVHQLVQEVIRENLSAEEKVESIVNAARLLHFAFSNCLSPDVLSKSAGSECSDRSSLHSTDFSRFYRWHKLCLHTYEIKRNLEKCLNDFTTVEVKSFFLPEVARILYECALHLNVNNYSSEAKTVADFANRILDWGDPAIPNEQLKALFPHTFPLLQPLRRRIQYSCRPPLKGNNLATFNYTKTGSMTSEIEAMRLLGNNFFKECNFEKALELYSSCIDSSKGTNSFDPKLLSNRASAYIRLNQYKNALEDAKEYIKYSPECWRGHAKKALALHGLNERWDAVCAAALAFYYDRNIFNSFSPFKAVFSYLKQRIHICDDLPLLISQLSQPPCGNSSDIPNKIIILTPGKYRLSVEDFGRYSLIEDKNSIIKRLCLANTFLLGVPRSFIEPCVTLSFVESFGLYSGDVMAVNISFLFDLGNWWTACESVLKLFNCTFTSKNEYCTLFSEGRLIAKKSRFVGSRCNGLCVAGNAEIEDSLFSGNESVGLQVLKPGNLVITESKLFGNQWGLDIKSGGCNMVRCQIYDNKKIGVGVQNGLVELISNDVFHNDRHGIFLEGNKSFATIQRNNIFENCYFGISTATDACCRVFRNKIYQNKYGGIHVNPIASDLNRQSVINFNEIFGNGGPGIDQSVTVPDEVGSPNPLKSLPFKSRGDLRQAKSTGNVIRDNIEEGDSPPSQDSTEICFLCCKRGQLRKCTSCFAAVYCNQECQKADWRKHRNNCAALFKKYSILVNISPKSFKFDTKYDEKFVKFAIQWKEPAPWLEPSGPDYAKPPQNGKRFVVKVQAADSRRRSNLGTSLLTLEDRSLTINGDLDKDEHSGFIYNLVMECGSNCKSVGWKKKFFWALLEGNKKIRVFIADFPPYQRW